MLSLNFESSIEGLGSDYWDVVEAAVFPKHVLQYRNDYVLQQLGIDSETITNENFIEAYGKFQGRAPFLALRYHGYQFGNYNPFLGDGRGFLYGQTRDTYGKLQDLGTKGSGQTPWSRGGDGRLTLKGGIREIIAGEALHKLGVTTSRTLSLIETGEKLWRGDEPSPTRSSVMVRIAQTHLRFGTCERFLYLRDPKGLEKLLKYVIKNHYPNIDIINSTSMTDCSANTDAQLIAFYRELVSRVAKLAAGWMSAGFTHGVLNTDNMSLAGESFDYGPFAFIEDWDPNFTAAYFDQTGMYSFGRQPRICYENLKLLQEPLAMLISREAMAETLDNFFTIYASHYRACLNRRLGFPANLEEIIDINPTKSNNNNTEDLIEATLQLLSNWDISYGDFFNQLAQLINDNGLPRNTSSLEPLANYLPLPPRKQWNNWRDIWHYNQERLISLVPNEINAIKSRLYRWNLLNTPVKSKIEAIWKSIDEKNDWVPFHAWINETSID
ncbi:Selenoprotein O-like [Prochlorococcus sp. SS52]|nr:Selenoprotein O-like [Prochlorococcus sp. SS52]